MPHASGLPPERVNGTAHVAAARKALAGPSTLAVGAFISMRERHSWEDQGEDGTCRRQEGVYPSRINVC